MHQALRKLELIIITYNRFQNLEKTVQAISNSPFKDCKVTIIDNNSTDDTGKVYERQKTYFQKLKYLKHNVNIGLGGNIVSAMVISKSEYTWILCDDDVLDFSCCDDVLDAINEGEATLIQVGAHEVYGKKWPALGQYFTPAQSLAAGYHYFAYSSFLPCNIFKTSYMQSYMIESTNNISSLYPHMPTLNHIYEDCEKIYICKQQIVTAVMRGHSYSYSSWLKGWMQVVNVLKKRSDRRTAFFDQNFGRNRGYVLITIYYNFLHKKIDTKTFFDILKLYGFLGSLFGSMALVLFTLASPIINPLYNRFKTNKV